MCFKQLQVFFNVFGTFDDFKKRIARNSHLLIGYSHKKQRKYICLVETVYRVATRAGKIEKAV